MTARAGRLAAPALVAALAGLSAAALAAWGASPYARFLDHANQPASAAGRAGAFALYLAGWLLMVTAMMLPAATQLVAAFGRATRQRADATRLQLALAGGFLGVWLVFGYVVRAADTLVHAVVASVAWLQARPSLLAAAALALAGAYQFAPFRHRCLTACRSPRSFILRGWTGGDARVDAMRIGFAYGRSCVGCCWALMLVMFGVGAANFGIMLGLAAVMAAERFAPARVPVGRATGGVLLGLAVVVAT